MNISISPENDKLKQEEEIKARIIAAAIKRFSYFGIQKTTLAEIADDTSIPRHSLNDFFADKGSLIKAAEETVVKEYLDKIRQFSASDDVLSSLLGYVDVKMSFFEKYFMLINQKENVHFFEWSEYINQVVVNVRKKEVDFLSNMIKSESASPVFHAEIIINTLSAVETSFRVNNPIPSSEDFLKLNEEQKNLITVLFKGIK